MEGLQKVDVPKVFLNKDKIVSTIGDLEFYPNVPKITEMPAYKGEKPSTPFKGGETQAIKILEKVCSNPQYVASFQKPMTNPCSIKPDTTGLSAYLKFGCMSSRMFYHKVQTIYDARKGNYTRPPESLHG